MFALHAKFSGGKTKITLRTGDNVAPLAELGWIVFDNPEVLLADMVSGKKMLGMKFEKREQVMAYLRGMTPAVAA
jgi:hypothetical protein